jgi:hypothetical protein
MMKKEELQETMELLLLMKLERGNNLLEQVLI